MASHQVAIAKASFAAGLLRPDPVSVSRDEIARFHVLLDGVATRCSPSNIQRCKDWLLDNVIPSTGRITVLAKYLVTLSNSFVAPDESSSAVSNGKKLSDQTRPSAKRKRLHILYLLNDLLHHTKYHTGPNSKHTSFAGNLQPHLLSLFKLAASFDALKHEKHHRKLRELLEVWQKHISFGASFIDSLRQTIKNAGTVGYQETGDTSEGKDGSDLADSTRPSRDVPYIMPASHGDPSTPYYDLPAANLMPHIIPNTTVPINPQLVKPLQFSAGPAEESLSNVVKEFLKEVETIYSPRGPAEDEGVVADIDEMGQRMTKDEVTGELVATEGYYGWTIAFCERMKKRKRGGVESISNGRGRGASRSPSSSRGSSAPRKRRRSISSRNSSRDRSSTGYRRRSDSRSRSRHHSRDRRDSPYRSRSRSRSPAHDPGSRPSFQPPPAALRIPNPRPPSNQPFVTPAEQIDNPFALAMPAAPTAPNANAFQHGFPIGPGGLPIPPPPPFHQGPWPPPPPAMPAGASFSPGQYPNFSTANFQHGNFVPPPPPGWRGQQHPQGPGFGQGATSPPPPPAPALGPGWQEEQAHGREYQHNQRNYRGSNARAGGNWNRGQDSRR